MSALGSGKNWEWGQKIRDRGLKDTRSKQGGYESCIWVGGRLFQAMCLEGEGTWRGALASRPLRARKMQALVKAKVGAYTFKFSHSCVTQQGCY